MHLLKIAAFSDNSMGGNPAGVAFCKVMPSDDEMLAAAREVGYSETAFLVEQADKWRVRYFAPAIEVPFCGHATIALAAALGERCGEGQYRLVLNDSEIRVKAERSADGFLATLYSPVTFSEDAPQEYVDAILAGFNFNRDHLDPAFPVRLVGHRDPAAAERLKLGRAKSRAGPVGDQAPGRGRGQRFE